VGLKIVLVIISSLRVDHMGLYGNRWLQTGGFDNLGKMGKVFTQARCRQANPLGTRLEVLTGLDSRRFAEPPRLHPDFTLPGQLRAKGFQTALFTDNFPLLSWYETINAFQTLYVVPGQGEDPHLPGVNAGPFNAELPNSILTGSDQLPEETKVENYIRNRGFHSHLSHPAVRLFSAAVEFLKNSEENSFLLIDSFGLQPPWEPPPEFARFRTVEELNTVAWPLLGPVNPQDKGIEKQLNFLRRAYADNCLFLDDLIGKIPSSGLNLYVMSDQGTLIGDENLLLSQPGWQHPALLQQALIACTPDAEKGTTSDEPVSPVDLFPTLLNQAKITPKISSDGILIKNPSPFGDKQSKI
jgi:arylsulfatase A-like enzyme